MDALNNICKSFFFSFYGVKCDNKRQLPMHSNQVSDTVNIINLHFKIWNVLGIYISRVGGHLPQSSYFSPNEVNLSKYLINVFINVKVIHQVRLRVRYPCIFLAKQQNRFFSSFVYFCYSTFDLSSNFYRIFQIFYLILLVFFSFFLRIKQT